MIVQLEDLYSYSNVGKAVMLKEAFTINEAPWSPRINHMTLAECLQSIRVSVLCSARPLTNYPLLCSPTGEAAFPSLCLFIFQSAGRAVLNHFSF